ncbi:glyoxylase-like metal-dependent hydrolase (beta-lactamase superfamily II) [Curtobacterium flaccumfaciens]|uniref:Glyoxylase-like metal-dependent hydrolase (Beta-lactamase superfamily II) n=1 Tax=Curtobacterium flaccumfaciens TaxID=2035 RepID=A0A4R6DKN1_9MICO|nr:MBL fold metallo-hydrolase [Curtobacterium flaccumfaciens]TDN45253.1 glyoxylase-like metal-dependent hydrolase (beta-lactamase superfamily II) [Curtobacterium flaccumfaciens]
MSSREPRSVVSVAPGVVFVEGPVSNWVVLAEEDGVALIDAGYPADTDLVLDTVRYAGHDLDDLRRVYVTHGHVDHVGGIPGILARYPDVQVLAHADELDNVRGPVRQQVTPAEIGGRLASPRVLRWLARAIRSDALRPTTVPTARAFTGADFDGRAITPLPAEGHTDGSTAYLLPAANAIVTGDAVVSRHDTQPASWSPRPRMITSFFTADQERAVESARALPIPEILLPGHGPAVHRVGTEWVPVSA